MEHGHKMDQNWLAAAVHVPPIGLIFAAFVGLLPTVAALVAVVWYCILIWESATLKEWRLAHARKALAKVKAKEQALLGLIAHRQASITPEDRSSP
jgi:hypothetical protein